MSGGGGREAGGGGSGEAERCGHHQPERDHHRLGQDHWKTTQQCHM